MDLQHDKVKGLLKMLDARASPGSRQEHGRSFFLCDVLSTLREGRLTLVRDSILPSSLLHYISGNVSITFRPNVTKVADISW